MQNTATLESPAAPVVPLGLADRCASCGAQAFMRVKLPDSSRLTELRKVQGVNTETIDGPGELEFCGHHGRKFEAVLAAAGASIDDQTDRINEKPSVSANA